MLLCSVLWLALLSVGVAASDTVPYGSYFKNTSGQTVIGTFGMEPAESVHYGHTILNCFLTLFPFR